VVNPRGRFLHAACWLAAMRCVLRVAGTSQAPPGGSRHSGWIAQVDLRRLIGGSVACKGLEPFFCQQMNRRPDLHP
jgi:hypothetical protein